MGRPKQMLWNIFCALVRQNTLDITASKENVVFFFQFEYAEFSGYVHIFRFQQQTSFLGKFGPTNQLVPGLIQICRIQWRCSIFLLFIGISLFGQIWSN